MTTSKLIAKYEALMSSRTRSTSCDGNDISRSQKAINKVVDELLSRADAGDEEAIAFF